MQLSKYVILRNWKSTVFPTAYWNYNKNCLWIEFPLDLSLDSQRGTLSDLTCPVGSQLTASSCIISWILCSTDTLSLSCANQSLSVAEELGNPLVGIYLLWSSTLGWLTSQSCISVWHSSCPIWCPSLFIFTGIEPAL